MKTKYIPVNINKERPGCIIDISIKVFTWMDGYKSVDSILIVMWKNAMEPVQTF